MPQNNIEDKVTYEAKSSWLFASRICAVLLPFLVLTSIVPNIVEIVLDDAVIDFFSISIYICKLLVAVGVIWAFISFLIVLTLHSRRIKIFDDHVDINGISLEWVNVTAIVINDKFFGPQILICAGPSRRLGIVGFERMDLLHNALQMQWQAH